MSIASGSSLAGEFASPTSQSYMEGFAYRPSSDALFKAELFRGFPVDAMLAKNLVWDTFMLETFAQRINQVTSASPYRFPREDVPLAGSGTFRNANLELTRVGTVQWDRQRLEILHYEAFFNEIDLDVSGMKLVGRSDYWGDVWVSPRTNVIQRATLYEEVIGELRLPSQTTPQPISVVRKGLFEKVSDR